jgi:hypothetical protein
MAQIVNETEIVDIEVFRGAPLPFTVWREIDGVIQAIHASIRLDAFMPNGDVLFTLIVGGGITLADYLSVVNGAAIFQFPTIDSDLLPINSSLNYRITTNPGGGPQVFIHGKLLGRP